MLSSSRLPDSVRPWSTKPLREVRNDHRTLTLRTLGSCNDSSTLPNSVAKSKKSVPRQQAPLDPSACLAANWARSLVHLSWQCSARIPESSYGIVCLIAAMEP
ncbi:hypothetical protein RRG08_008985 [Elysia crispata]|uniref:Uncharacterized protein n=1 Tax=Elysia crispata TaxID=231223 RepID=A0AAE1ATI6_9GAST|nr:hypothetical protein RRG08_008985 [Elysia crispata]